MVMQPAGNLTAFLAFNRNAVAFAVRFAGQGILADFLIFEAFRFQPDGQVLARLVIGDRLAVDGPTDLVGRIALSAGIVGAVFQDSRTRAEEQATIDRSYELAVKAGAEGGKLLGAGKRLLTGESLFTTVYLNQGQRKRRVAFSEVPTWPTVSTVWPKRATANSMPC